MAEYLGIKLGKWFFSRGMIEEKQIDDIRYGFEIFCSEILEFITIICYGFFTNTYLETGIYILLFRIVRSEMPGYHAKTIWICFILTIGSYIITMYTYQYVNTTSGFMLLMTSLIVQGMYIKYTFQFR